MRAELVKGLTGARKIHAQLKEGNKREQELRAKNSLLQTKILKAADPRGRNKKVRRRGWEGGRGGGGRGGSLVACRT